MADNRKTPPELQCLRHLRELRADGNRITSIDGLQKLDGLTKLSLQGNQIQEADFSKVRWYESFSKTPPISDEECIQVTSGDAKPKREPSNQCSKLGINITCSNCTEYRWVNLTAILCALDDEHRFLKTIIKWTILSLVA